MPDPVAAGIVLDASAAVEALIGTSLGVAVRVRMRGRKLNSPAHLDAEVLSALARLHRAQALSEAAVASGIAELSAAPIERHLLGGLLRGAWEARDRLRIVDALYVELSRSLHLPLLTTDARLARAASGVTEIVVP